MNPALRLTPCASPFIKNGPLRPLNRPLRPDPMLSLRQVIGTTSASANAFDSLPSDRAISFTAGAAAVIATIDQHHHITQRFFRARPTPAGAPAPSSTHDSRSRAAASQRDAGVGASSYGSPGADWADSPGGKSWTARERIKAATCVSFSPDGKYLAVGETGYKPRVLVFSTAPDAAPDTPVTTMSEHAFGVRCLAFSPDSKYLASLGSANDGFLYIWALNSRTGAATLHASNKCTNHVNKIVWLGNSLVVVGIRHVKVWRADEAEHQQQQSKPRHGDANPFASPHNKTLPGRNCVLGSLLEANFTSVAPVAPAMAIISTDRGDICLLDDTERAQRFFRVATVPFGVSALAADVNGLLHIAGMNGDMVTMEIEKLTDTSTPPPSPTSRGSSPTSPTFNDIPYTIAIAPIDDLLVTVDSRRAIRLVEVGSDADAATNKTVQKLPAQGEAVLGVHSLPLSNFLDASFFTWSADGTVKFWGHDGTSKGDIVVRLEQLENCDEVNELKVVQASPHLDFLAAGDKFGLLSIIDGKTGKMTSSLKAHGSEITDMAIRDGEAPLVVSAARDRTVQVFQKKGESWDLLQTLDEHASAVTGLLFSNDGQRLLSSSADRTVVVRDYVTREEDGNVMTAFLIARTITLKATPVSMVFDDEREDILVVSTVDRQVHKYDIRSGQVISSFKASDSEGGDSVVLSDLVHFSTAKGQGIIAGVSSTDKSIRVYDENGNLLGRDWGHTEGVTDIAMVTSKDEQKCLVTVAVDGTIFVWNLDFKPPQQRYDVAKHMDLMGVSTPNASLLASKPPLRRVLSQTEIAKYHRSGEDSEATTPTGGRSPTLRKRTSKMSLHGTPKLEPSPMASSKDHSLHVQTSRKSTGSNRSPSPPSPKNAQSPKNAHSPKNQHSPKVAHSPKPPHHGLRRPSFGSRTKARSNQNLRESANLASSTEQLCRSLRAYRKKLQSTSDNIPSEAARELERELTLTVRAVGDKSRTKQPMDEAAMIRLLDQYSERLVEMLDEKIAQTVALHVRQSSESAASAAGARAGERRVSSGAISSVSQTTTAAGQEDEMDAA